MTKGVRVRVYATDFIFEVSEVNKWKSTNRNSFETSIYSVAWSLTLSFGSTSFGWKDFSNCECKTQTFKLIVAKWNTLMFTPSHGEREDLRIDKIEYEKSPKIHQKYSIVICSQSSFDIGIFVSCMWLFALLMRFIPFSKKNFFILKSLNHHRRTNMWQVTWCFL